jgi:ElaB/YqjD/DUF883 family membrane-anchored ribosome-binding protein
MSRNGHSAADELREDVMRLQADLKGLIDRVSDIGDDLTKVVRQEAGGIEKSASRLYTRATREAGGYTATVEKSIAQHPFSSAVIALAAGILISKLFGGASR